MPKPKILLLLHELSWTGAPRVGLEAFDWIGDRCELQIVSLAEGPRRAEAQKLGVTRVLMESKPPLGLLLKAMPRGAALRLSGKVLEISRALPRFAPDLIYVNSVVALNFARYLQLPRAPVLLHVHELGSAIEGQIGRFPDLLQKLPAAYLADSQAVRASLVERFGVAESKISVVHPFISPANFAEFSVPTPTSPSPQTPFVVGGAGGFAWCKGAQLWLLMAAHLKSLLGADRVKFRYLGRGEAEAMRHFEEMVRRLELQTEVELTALAPDSFAFFAQLDAFALTSWEDASPLVALENMMLSKPVVCFAGGGGAPEEVGDTGIVIPNFSPEAMARALAELARDPARRQQLGHSARQRVIENFTIETQAPKIWRAIETVLQAG